MKLIKAIIRPNKVDDLKEAFAKIQIAGMTVTEVRGHGRQKGHTAVYRGREYEVTLLPKMQIETVVPDELVEPALQAIREAARTGEIGDGRVFICPVEQSYNIRTGERDDSVDWNLDVSCFPHAPHAHNATDHCCFWLRWTTVRAVSVTAAAIEGEAQPEVVALRRLAFGRKNAEQRHGAVAAVLLLLIAQREVERRLDVPVVGRHGPIGIGANGRPGAVTTARRSRRAPSQRPQRRRRRQSIGPCEVCWPASGVAIIPPLSSAPRNDLRPRLSPGDFGRCSPFLSHLCPSVRRIAA